MTSPTKRYLTPNEVAELLMVAPNTVRVWSEKGMLQAQTTAGGHRRFRASDVERFLRERGGEPPADRPLRVLIVDDDAALARYLTAWLSGLEERKVITAAAANGFAAGHMFHAFNPDVILLDLMMPGVDGFQACRQIKADPLGAAIRIIAMTGDPSPENVAAILAAGAEECLAKPIDEDRLLALLGANPPSDA